MVTDEPMILGIESSCDETGCAVVTGGGKVLSNQLATQTNLHARFGGIVPEVASRAHVNTISKIISQALEEACVTGDDLAAVAVANEPGLIGSLLVGLSAAKALAWGWSIPLVAINHVHAHACAPVLGGNHIEYPATALICSGGHTSLYHCQGPADMDLLGSTVDDAAGEAFDKVAAILRLGYPGGPAIDRASACGDPHGVKFPRSLLGKDSLDFSFSGLKTAVLYHVNGVPGADGAMKNCGAESLGDQEICDIAASFQHTVVEILIEKLRRALRVSGSKSIIIGGGVAANSALRTAAGNLASRLGLNLYVPELKYCTDNAAMIAIAGFYRLGNGHISRLDTTATATVKL